MNTDQLPAPVNTITEADVSRFLATTREKLCLSSDCVITAGRGNLTNRFSISGQTAPTYKLAWGSGETIAEAHAAFLVSQANIKAGLDASLATIVPVPVIQDREGCGV